MLDPDPTSVCPRSSDPFYIVTYYIKLVTTSGHIVFSNAGLDPIKIPGSVSAYW